MTAARIVYQLSANGEMVPVLLEDEGEEEDGLGSEPATTIVLISSKRSFRLEAQAKSPASTNVVDVSNDVRLPGQVIHCSEIVLGHDHRFGRRALKFCLYLDTAEVTRIRFDDRNAFNLNIIQVNIRTATDDGFGSAFGSLKH